MKTHMKNKIQKLITISTIALGAFIQIGCAPWLYEGYDDDYTSSDYSYEKEKLDPSNLSKSPKDEKVEAGLCKDARNEYLKQSDASIYDLAINSSIGNCVLVDAATCESCFCPAYVKVTTSTWPAQGWALNPESRDSTGCVDHVQWGGYTPEMAGPNLAQNAVEQIRDALRNDNDVCGLCNPEREITAEMILDQ